MQSQIQWQTVVIMPVPELNLAMHNEIIYNILLISSKLMMKIHFFRWLIQVFLKLIAALCKINAREMAHLF